MKLSIKKAKEMMRQNGGSLDLSDTQIAELPDNLTVGGSLDLRGTQIADKFKTGSKVQKLHNGDYVPNRYLYADGILTHIKGCRTVAGYTLFVGKIKGKNVVYDGSNYAHCDKLRDGIADLIFKAASDRGADQYKGFNLDTEMTVPELKTMYRIITGACEQGTNAFVNSLGKLKKKYTIREAIDITEGQYNAEKFSDFFSE